MEKKTMANEILVLSEEEIRSCVSLNMEALQEVAQGFTFMAQDKVTIPPILRIDVRDNNGEVDVKTAYLHGLDSFAIKIASGFVDNHLLGLPTGSGMMVVMNAKTGNPLAILLDNGYLTDVRTGIAGAIAAQHLGREKVTSVGVIGSGAQARFQIQALKLVRNFSRVLVFGLIDNQVNEYVIEMSEALGVEVIKAESAEAVVRQCEIVVTTTPSKTPYLKKEWLHPGLHITCMGSDSEEKQEIHADVFGAVDRIVCDKKSQVFRLGELHHALEGEFITENEVSELGQLTAGLKPGRQSQDEITICDLTGVGIQDTQIARLAFHRAVDRGLGIKVQ
jgi:ectoine utilization protein EutC